MKRPLAKNQLLIIDVLERITKGGIKVICDGYYFDFFEGLSDFRLK